METLGAFQADKTGTHNQHPAVLVDSRIQCQSIVHRHKGKLLFHRIQPGKGGHKGHGTGGNAHFIVGKNGSVIQHHGFIVLTKLHGLLSIDKLTIHLFRKTFAAVIHFFRGCLALQIVGNQGAAVHRTVLPGDHVDFSLRVCAADALHAARGGHTVADDHILLHLPHLSS